MDNAAIWIWMAGDSIRHYTCSTNQCGKLEFQLLLCCSESIVK